MTTVLETEDLRREFGALVAVDDVSLGIDSEDITSIIGPNGAGKTTFYNLLTGQLDPTAGRVRIRPRGDGAAADGGEQTPSGARGASDGGATVANDGLVDVTGMEPYEINRMGLSRAFQINNVFMGLTVLENVRIARISRDGRARDFTAVAAEDDELNEEAYEVLEQTDLEEIAETKCANLSHGDIRKVEIALALGTDPSVVLLDEPTAGMNASETRRMVRLIERLDENTGTTFVLTEHDMEVVVGISDRIIVLDNGELIASGTPDEVMADERVKEAYLGGEGR